MRLAEALMDWHKSFQTWEENWGPWLQRECHEAGKHAGPGGQLFQRQWLILEEGQSQYIWRTVSLRRRQSHYEVYSDVWPWMFGMGISCKKPAGAWWEDFFLARTLLEETKSQVYWEMVGHQKCSLIKEANLEDCPPWRIWEQTDSGMNSRSRVCVLCCASITRFSIFHWAVIDKTG